MRKKSAIMTATIASIITTSVLAFALPNQVLAQQVGQQQAGKVLAEDEVQVGKVLDSHPGSLPQHSQQDPLHAAAAKHSCRLDEGVCSPIYEF